MAFSSITRALGRSPLTTELLAKLQQHQHLKLNGLARLPKGLVSSALAQAQSRNLLVVTATLEEAGRWTAQLDAMGWQTVHFYPTSESSPYEPFDPESEMVWGQLQVLAELVRGEGRGERGEEETGAGEAGGAGEAELKTPFGLSSGRKQNSKLKTLAPHSSLLTPHSPLAIVTTERALQPHLPPVSALKPYCLTLKRGTDLNLETLGHELARLGYDRVPLVETEGQWSRRGDIIDVFPVASELPVRLELFGDELDQIREFDPATQRSLDRIEQLVLTPTNFTPIIQSALTGSKADAMKAFLSEEDQEKFDQGQLLEGSRRFLGIAFDKPASLLDYLPENTLIAIDEPDQSEAHGDRWFEHAEEQYGEFGSRESGVGSREIPRIHRSFVESLAAVELFNRLYLSELAEEPKVRTAQDKGPAPMNLASRPVPAIPHQFGRLAETLRDERDRGFSIWLVSAQPSRSVSLLQEHDCPAQFIPNPRDYLAIDKLQVQHVPVAVKYSGLAELEGFILPTFRLVVVTDREFFGQHSLATPSYVRKRRRAASKQVDPNKLRPGDYVVHKNHGVGRFSQAGKPDAEP